MAEQIQKQVSKTKKELPEIETLPEPIDESRVIALADLVLVHIDNEISSYY